MLDLVKSRITSFLKDPNMFTVLWTVPDVELRLTCCCLLEKFSIDMLFSDPTPWESCVKALLDAHDSSFFPKIREHIASVWAPDLTKPRKDARAFVQKYFRMTAEGNVTLMSLEIMGGDLPFWLAESGTDPKKFPMFRTPEGDHYDARQILVFASQGDAVPIWNRIASGKRRFPPDHFIKLSQGPLSEIATQWQELSEEQRQPYFEEGGEQLQRANEAVTQSILAKREYEKSYEFLRRSSCQVIHAYQHALQAYEIENANLRSQLAGFQAAQRLVDMSKEF